MIFIHFKVWDLNISKLIMIAALHFGYLSHVSKQEDIRADVANTRNGERGTGNGKRETGNGERGTGNGQRATGNGQRATGNGEPETGNGSLGTSAQR